MWRNFCGWLLRKLGWTIDGGLPPEKKCILLGAPHTTIWDFAIAYLYYKSLGGDAKCMVKKEMFIPPVSWLLRALGGFPVDRKNAAAIVRSVIKQMEESESFHLAIAPEGTRKPVKHWKTGFHLIAKTTNIPVYLAYFDWGRKHIGHGPKFEISDDARADMKRIQEIYESMNLTGKHPENFVTR